jgi:hypothetical protein
MTDQDFQNLLAIYGADLSRWPVASRDASVQWLAAHPKARRDQEREAGIDRLLAEAAPIIDDGRVFRLAHDLAEAVDGMVPGGWGIGDAIRTWNPLGAVYLGLFVLGCAANTVLRLLTAQTPLEAWLATNLTVALGG